MDLNNVHWYNKITIEDGKLRLSKKFYLSSEYEKSSVELFFLKDILDREKINRTFKIFISLLQTDDFPEVYTRASTSAWSLTF